jgi:hypothetical protein
MLTNLLAQIVITLVTNVVQTDNAVWVPDYSVAYATYPAQFGQRISTPATERYLTTNVTEHTTVTVPLSDGPAVFTKDKLLSSVTGILRKLEDWQPAGVRTNDPAPPPWTGILLWNSMTNTMTNRSAWPLNVPLSGQPAPAHSLERP